MKFKHIIPTILILVSSLSIANEIENINLLNKIGYGNTGISLKEVNNLGYDKWVLKQINSKDQHIDEVNTYKFPDNNEAIFNQYNQLSTSFFIYLIIVN